MKVITSAVNPFFIELQYSSLKKFLKQDFEYIVFNDAKEYPDFTNDGNLNFKNEINNICLKLNIKCIELDNKIIPPYNNYPSYKHYIVLTQMYNYQMANPDKYLLLDNDIILIDYLDINKYNGYKAAIVLVQKKNNNNTISYMWPCLCYLDFTFPDNDFHLLNWQIINQYTNVGGGSMIWLNKQILSNERIPTEEEVFNDYNKKYNTSLIYFMPGYMCGNWNKENYPSILNEKYPKLLSFLINDIRNSKNNNNNFTPDYIDNCYFHFRCSSNWNNDGTNFYHNLVSSMKEIFDL